MPKLHPITGLAACGTAGGRVSLGVATAQQRVLCDGGCTFWYNADEIAYIGPESGTWDGGGRTIPQRVNIHTGARTPLEEVPVEQIRQANFMGAGGNRWQAAIAGPGYSYGMCGEHPGGSVSRAMTDGRGAASADGTIAIIDSYQGTGNGFRLGRPDGSIFPPEKDAQGNRVPGIAEGSDPYFLTVIDKDRAIWAAPGEWGTFGITPKPLWLKNTNGRACWCEVNGNVVLVHWLNGVGLVAREQHSSRGKVLAREDKEFHYDAIAWAGGVRVCWALWDGEAPGSLVIVDWDCVSDLEDLVPPIPPIVYPEYHFEHSVLVVPFKDPENTSGALAEVLVNKNNQGNTRRPLFVAEDTLGSTWNGPLLGIYTEAKDPIRLSAVIEEAGKRQTRVLWCHDSDGPLVIPPGLRRWDIPAMEMYWYKKKGETLLNAVARWHRDMDALLRWPGDLALVPMFYCMGQLPPNEDLYVSEVLQTHAYISEFTNRSTRVKLLVPFSYLRGNGIVAHPELERSFDDMRAAAPPGVTLIPVPKPNPPDPEPEPTTPYPAARPYKRAQ